MELRTPISDEPISICCQSCGEPIHTLLIMRPHDLAEILGIDEYVAKIIISAAYDIRIKVKASSIIINYELKIN